MKTPNKSTGELARSLNSAVNGVTTGVVWWVKQKGPHVLTQQTRTLMDDWDADMAGLHGGAEGSGFHPRLSVVLCGV